MDSKPMCVAPYTCAAINTDKGVMPCAVWSKVTEDGCTGIGRLRRDGPTIQQVMASPAWQEVCDELARGEVPEGCKDCIDRDRDYSFGMVEHYDDPNWDKGLTYLEVNTTNICTLQCRQCNPRCSHFWARDMGWPTHKPDSELLMRSVHELDLTWLRRTMFKGGEPMLNPDMPAVLEYLDSIGKLGEVTVQIVTNCTTVNEAILPLLSRAGKVELVMSIDGTGDVQTYIRHGPSSLDVVEESVRKLAVLPNIEFFLHPSVVSYNVFSLQSIHEWWIGLQQRVDAKFCPLTFTNIVVFPTWVSIHILRDATRQRLIDHYSSLDPHLYRFVIQALGLPFAGEQQRELFIQNTIETDRKFGRSLFDVVPEMIDELQPPPLAKAWRALGEGRPQEAIDLASRRRTLHGLFPMSDTERFESFGLLTEAYTGSARFEEALAIVRQALSDAPDHPDILVRKGMILSHAGRFGEVETLCQELTEQRWPDHARDLSVRLDRIRNNWGRVG